MMASDTTEDRLAYNPAAPPADEYACAGTYSGRVGCSAVAYSPPPPPAARAWRPWK